MSTINPFNVGDTVFLKKPTMPFPSNWPPEASTYAFGIPEDVWDRSCGRPVEVTSLTAFQGCDAIGIDNGTYCWPIEFVFLQNISRPDTKIPCNCSSIFIKGCQNKKDHY